MEFLGTKGEWKIKDKHSFETDIYCGKIRIAEAKHYNDGDGKFKNDPKKREGRANAQLIVAAPELLEALKSCVLSMQSHPDYTENSEFEAFVNKGWEVITKATKLTNQQKKPNGFNEWINKINDHVKNNKL